MNNERVLAGVFGGLGSLTAIILGSLDHDPTLQTAGLLILSSMMAFFVGEKNGQKTTKNSTA